MVIRGDSEDTEGMRVGRPPPPRARHYRSPTSLFWGPGFPFPCFFFFVFSFFGYGGRRRRTGWRHGGNVRAAAGNGGARLLPARCCCTCGVPRACARTSAAATLADSHLPQKKKKKKKKKKEIGRSKKKKEWMEETNTRVLLAWRFGSRVVTLCGGICAWPYARAVRVLSTLHDMIHRRHAIIYQFINASIQSSS